jgi:hypothetical protein
MSPVARRWTCDRCSVAVGRIDGSRVPLPANWIASADGCFCLTCRRERAAEAALDAAPTDSSSDTRNKMRRAGLIEFEVRRAPDRADNAIARACHTSASAVTAVRQRLQSPLEIAASERHVTAARR